MFFFSMPNIFYIWHIAAYIGVKTLLFKDTNLCNPLCNPIHWCPFKRYFQNKNQRLPSKCDQIIFFSLWLCIVYNISKWRRLKCDFSIYNIIKTHFIFFKHKIWIMLIVNKNIVLSYSLVVTNNCIKTKNHATSCAVESSSVAMIKTLYSICKIVIHVIINESIYMYLLHVYHSITIKKMYLIR